jgi:hypothetical protein
MVIHYYCYAYRGASLEMPVWARDLPLLLAEVYAKLGATLSDDPEAHLIDLVEWLGRLPSKRPRRVHISDVLRGRKILTAYEINGINRVRRALEYGSDLRPFLGERTNSIRNRRYEKRTPRLRNDLFFSDWGLHHFHLGADLANTGKRVMRSRRVMIAHLTEEDAYLLDVVTHGKGFSSAWGRTDYLKTLHRNWPEVLEKYELKGVMAPAREDQFEAEDYIRLRENGINLIVPINGKTFMGPGFGISGDGSSTRAVQLADKIRYELAEGEKLFRGQQPGEEVCLFVAKDASVGFFSQEKDTAFSIFPSRHKSYHVTSFFVRLLDESGILNNAPEGSIWTPPISIKPE